MTPHTWKNLLQRAGAPYQLPHALHYRFASTSLEAGESPAYIEEQVGRSPIKITVDIYGHLVPGLNREAVDRLPWSMRTSQSGGYHGNRAETAITHDTPEGARHD